MFGDAVGDTAGPYAGRRVERAPASTAAT